MSIISLLVSLLVVALVVYVVKLIIDVIPLPQPVKTIALIIVGIIALVYILSLFGVHIPLGVPLLK